MSAPTGSPDGDGAPVPPAEGPAAAADPVPPPDRPMPPGGVVLPGRDAAGAGVGRFGRGGFVSAALRTGVPIVPCSVVGAEEIYPLVGNIPSLARLLGMPYIPITPFFPWLGPLGMIPLPSKWLIEFGEPIRTDSYDGGAADDPMLVFNVTDQVRETIQQTLYTLLMQRRSVFF